MSRNKNRISGQAANLEAENATPNIHHPTPQQPSNPFGLSFVSPTEIVELPSQGLFYGPDHPLHGVASLEIKQMTAKEEDIIANEGFLSSGEAYDRLLDSLIVNNGVTSRHLLSGDKDALLMRARITGYGQHVPGEDFCSACDKTVEVQYDLSEIKNQIPETPEGVEYSEGDCIFYFTLPKSGIKIGMELLTGLELEFLKKQKQNKERLKLPTNDTIDFLRKAIKSANGITEEGLLSQLAEVLPAIDARKIRVMQSRLSPGINTSQKVKCTECEAEIDSEIQFNINFFWPKL